MAFSRVDGAAVAIREPLPTELGRFFRFDQVKSVGVGQRH